MGVYVQACVECLRIQIFIGEKIAVKWWWECFLVGGGVFKCVCVRECQQVKVKWNSCHAVWGKSEQTEGRMKWRPQ